MPSYFIITYVHKVLVVYMDEVYHFLTMVYPVLSRQLRNTWIEWKKQKQLTKEAQNGQGIEASSKNFIYNDMLFFDSGEMYSEELDVESIYVII